MEPERFDTSACHLAVLEDSPTSQVIVQRLLMRHFNCTVSCYSTPEELWADCTSLVPDFFLLDVVLQDEKTGIDVCRELQACEATRDIPVIFFSEHNQPRTRLEALRAGGVDYIDKPFYPAEFLQRVDRNLQRFLHQKKLQSQTHEQMALLRVLCHDLRNSVGASMAMLTQGLETSNPDERSFCLEICQKATRSALDLITHVGEYRTLLDSAQSLKMEPVDVASAIEEACNLVSPAASAKKISIHTTVPPQLALLTNRVVLVHNIVVNLLTNAIKFSLPGSRITIEARTSPVADPSHATCDLTISDEGIGIPPSILGSLLKRELVQSRPGTAREQGTGIGMSLVQLYVERCQGSLQIESFTAETTPPGQKPGTRVQLRFPL